MAYNRDKAVRYAHKWAFKRNRHYLDFSGIGGDCTNFISQCLYAGGADMNYTEIFGWYYNSEDDRAAAWTGVQYLYNFLVKNEGPGPFGSDIPLYELLPGDIVQISFQKGIFSHSLLVVETGKKVTPDTVLIATHSLDSDYRPLSTYSMLTRRCLKIDVR